jgi:hypothetical protein
MRVGARRSTAGRWEPVGAVGVATTGGALCGLSREQACELDGDQALAHLGQKAYPDSVASAHGGRYVDELDSRRKLAKGAIFPYQAYA